MIRKVTPFDLAEIVDLLQQLSPYPVEPDTEALHAKIQEMAACGHVRVFGYEDGGKVVGMCTVGRIKGLSKNCRPFAVIENIVVHATMRGNGIGTELVRRAIDQVEEWGCYKVILETGTKNEWKLQFYEKCGLIRGDKTAFIKRFR